MCFSSSLSVSIYLSCGQTCVCILFFLEGLWEASLSVGLLPCIFFLYTWHKTGDLERRLVHLPNPPSLPWG